MSDKECVYCAVRTGSLNITNVTNFSQCPWKRDTTEMHKMVDAAAQCSLTSVCLAYKERKVCLVLPRSNDWVKKLGLS